jgi:hypothetical protein
VVCVQDLDVASKKELAPSGQASATVEGGAMQQQPCKDLTNPDVWCKYTVGGVKIQATNVLRSAPILEAFSEQIRNEKRSASFGDSPALLYTTSVP